MTDRPTISELAKRPTCPNCGGTVMRRSPKGPVPTFCDAKGRGVCKREMNNRLTVEGRALAAFVKAWRIDRGTGDVAKGAFAQLCEIADRFNAADLAAGRPRIDLHVAKLLADGTRYIDRRRGPLAPRVAANKAKELDNATAA